MIKIKTKKCPICKNKFFPRNSLQKVCGIDCSIKTAEKIRKTIDRKELLVRKEKLKSRSDHLKEAQSIFNAYIRERDRDLPCISCGRTSGSWDAGHYRSVGACPELRFEEINVHKQDVHCNQFKSGNILEYRIGLIEKIGIEKVEWLEGSHNIKKYTIPEIIEIKRIYKLKIKYLKNKL